MDNEQADRVRTQPLLLAVTWLAVLLPALWGVGQTAVTSRKLFQSTPTTVPATDTPATTPAAPGNTLPQGPSTVPTS